jgi:hypothetical protein
VGTGVIVNGTRELVLGVDVENWLDNPVLRLTRGEDFAPGARAWLRAIVLHTTKGLAGASLAGFGPPVDAGFRCARYWSSDGRQAGAHLVVDHDGAVSCLADLGNETAYHCPRWNTCSVGIELYQGGAGELYEGQLDVCVRLVDWLTRRFGIQRQIPHQYVRALERFLQGEESVVGVIGHRDAARNRGVGDPGNAIFNRLGLAGYEPLNFEVRDDLERWRQRQRELGLPKDQVDGIPGPITVAALRARGKPGRRGERIPLPAGLWVPRPGDPPAGAPRAV